MGEPQSSALGAGWLLLLVLAACSGTASAPLRPVPPQREAASPAGTAAELAWGISAELEDTQRIIRLSYQDRRSDGAMKLVLRLVDGERFSLQGNDQFSRSWFRIAVADGRALFLDLRDKTYCVYSEAIEIRAVPLGPLPFDSLPAMLLGRLPIEPLAAKQEEEGRWSYRDRHGRKWTARTAAGQLQSWTLWRDREPEVYWSTDGRLAYLSARSEGLQMRWRSARSEPLSRPPEGIDPPPDFVELCQ